METPPLPQEIFELLRVALVALRDLRREEEGHLGVRRDVGVELDESLLLFPPGVPDLQPPPVLPDGEARGVARRVARASMLGLHYQRGRQPDQTVEVLVWDVFAVLLNRVVAWKVLDSADLPVLPARGEEGVGGAVGETEDRPDEETYHDRPWIGWRPSDCVPALHLVRRF